MGGVWRIAGYVATAMLVWLTGATLAGQTCGQEWLVRYLAARDARLEERLARQQEMLDSAMETNRGHFVARVAKVIPVVFHVVWRTPEENLSDETILAVLDGMNRDFAGQNEDLWRVPEVFRSRIAAGGIQFCLAGQDPSGTPSSGIIRVRTDWKEVGLSEALYHTQAGGSDAWDPERYLNIWIADTGEFVCGFGTYPGLVPMERQGIVVDPDCLRPVGQSGKVRVIARWYMKRDITSDCVTYGTTTRIALPMTVLQIRLCNSILTTVALRIRNLLVEAMICS